MKFVKRFVTKVLSLAALATFMGLSIPVGIQANNTSIARRTVNDSQKSGKLAHVMPKYVAGKTKMKHHNTPFRTAGKTHSGKVSFRLKNKSVSRKSDVKLTKNSVEYKETKTRYTTKKVKHGKDTLKQQIIRKKTVNNAPKSKRATVPDTINSQKNNNVSEGSDSNSSSTISSNSDAMSTSSSTSSVTTTPTLSPQDAQTNQDAQNANIRLQPDLTKSQIAANQGQYDYDETGAVSNLVGQGTAIVNSICEVISTIKNLL